MPLRRIGIVFVLVLSTGAAALPAALAQTAPPLAPIASEAHPTFVAEMTAFEEVPGASSLAKGFTGLQFSADGTRVYYTITVTDT